MISRPSTTPPSAEWCFITMLLKYFIKHHNGKLAIDSVVENESKKTEDQADFVRWIDANEPMKLVPPVPYTSVKEYAQELARQSDFYWRGR